MKNFIFVIVFLMIGHSSAYSQDKIAINTVFFELIGNGGIYSINYDRLMSNSTSVRLGFSYVPSSNGIYSITFPIMLNDLEGQNNSKLELGVGAMFFHVSQWWFPFLDANVSSGIFICGTIGYRYQKKEGGSFFRIGFTPYYGYGFFFPCIGISIGKTFDFQTNDDNNRRSIVCRIIKRIN